MSTDFYTSQEVYQEVTVSTKQPQAIHPLPFRASSSDERFRAALTGKTADGVVVRAELWIEPLVVNTGHAFGYRAEFPTCFQVITSRVSKVQLEASLALIDRQLRSCIVATCLG